ncbi:flagellar export chaperone FliS [bacterium]|nr:flagellar export chaperone FliS [bacterium]
MTGYQDYARTDIQTSDPRAVVVLLYEAAIRFLNQAAIAARQEERMEMSRLILKTNKIIHFLSNALDFEQGAEIAENLHKLYTYMRDILHEANLHADPDKIDEVLNLIKPLHEAWREIAKDPNAASAALERRAGDLAVQPPGAGPRPRIVQSDEASVLRNRPNPTAARAAYGLKSF